VIVNDGNTVGGETPEMRNLISGNTGPGILIFTSNNVVKGNYFGTNAAGTAALGNQTGVWLFSTAVGNTIGGTTVGARNVISGNNVGLLIQVAGSSSNIVMGNFIGTDAAGPGTISNRIGVLVSGGTHDNVVGGIGSGQGNVIAFNIDDGVCVVSDNTLGNSIRGNFIHSNGQLGINLATAAEGACPAGAVTANDAGDVDIGANGLMNFPVITFSFFDGINTTVSGTLDTIAPGTSAVDVYATDVPDVSGNGQGRTYLGSTTAPAGNWSLVISGSLPFPHLTATATDAGGNTSEFSLTLTDLDGDGIADMFETNTGIYVSPTDTGTDPNDADSDDDGLEDGAETALGTDPNEPDHDADGVCDGGGLGGGACTAGPDNCPLAANPAPQTDSGGIDTTTPDGIGDVCQCGDATNNGIVDAADIQVVRENLVGATLSDAFIGKRCNVIGLRAGDASGSDCDVEDVYQLRRAVAGEVVLIENTCDAYFGL
jgi:hypothetical protein